MLTENFHCSHLIVIGQKIMCLKGDTVCKVLNEDDLCWSDFKLGKKFSDTVCKSIRQVITTGECKKNKKKKTYILLAIFLLKNQLDLSFKSKKNNCKMKYLTSKVKIS